MLKKLPRMTDWILITILLIGLIALLSPQQLPVSLYKLSLITMAAAAGYWIDRSLFPYARPDRFYNGEDEPMVRAVLASSSMLRRAIIIGCAMLAVSLGM
jgi:hypothetical protein